MANGYKKLIVWQKSKSLAIEVYTITKFFPKEEQFGLISQMRRAAISIPSNIAEGSKRKTRKDFCNFLSIAHGSAAELETQIEIAKEIYPSIEFDQSEETLYEITKMLPALCNSLTEAKNCTLKTENS